MELVRLYVLQDNRRWQETISEQHLLQRLAELELNGAVIEHASRMQQIKPQRLKRGSLAGAAKHLYA